VAQRFSQPIKLWDGIVQLTDLSDVSLNKYRCWVDQNDRFYYRMITNDPVATVFKDRIAYGDTGSELSPWYVEPGIFRDPSHLLQEAYYDGWYQRTGDFLVDEVEVSISGRVALKSDFFRDESEALADQAEWEDAEVKEQKKRRKRTNWKKLQKTKVVSTTPAQKSPYKTIGMT